MAINGVCNYFSTIGSDLVLKISPLVSHSPLDKINWSNSFVFLKLDESEVGANIMNLRHDSVTGYDGIQFSLLKLCKNTLVPVINVT